MLYSAIYDLIYFSSLSSGQRFKLLTFFVVVVSTVYGFIFIFYFKAENLLLLFIIINDKNGVQKLCLQLYIAMTNNNNKYFSKSNKTKNKQNY